MVEELREALVSGGKISQVTKRTGKDGKEYSISKIQESNKKRATKTPLRRRRPPRRSWRRPRKPILWRSTRSRRRPTCWMGTTSPWRSSETSSESWCRSSTRLRFAKCLPSLTAFANTSSKRRNSGPQDGRTDTGRSSPRSLFERPDQAGRQGRPTRTFDSPNRGVDSTSSQPRRTKSAPTPQCSAIAESRQVRTVRT